MKNITKLRMYIPTLTDWIESNLIVRADIYKKRKLINSFEVSRITVSDILEIAASDKEGCYIRFEDIQDIGIVDGVCAIEYNDLTIMITRE